MTVRRGDSPLASGIDACQRHEDASGGHSWGYAISDGEKLETFTQVGTIDTSAMSPEAEVALVHTRLATRGEITEENAHPFLIHWHEPGGASRTAALAHNGTWHDAPRDHRADSWHMARELEASLEDDAELRDAVESLGALTSETFIVVTDTARALVHSGRFRVTADDVESPRVVQSSELDEIPTGSILEL
jgi:predicted glutamine amidotransferase